MKRVLVVDDSAFMRVSVKNMLTEHGYIVVGEADNGQTAFERYKELLPDVVTLDITMKGVSGIEALKKIMEFDANAKVIMVSAMGQRPFIEEAIVAGARGFLIKPFKKDQVISAIQKC